MTGAYLVLLKMRASSSHHDLNARAEGYASLDGKVIRHGIPFPDDGGLEVINTAMGEDTDLPL